MYAVALYIVPIDVTHLSVIDVDQHFTNAVICLYCTWWNLELDYIYILHNRRNNDHFPAPQYNFCVCVLLFFMVSTTMMNNVNIITPKFDVYLFQRQIIIKPIDLYVKYNIEQSL
jgi:hypothetical protein